MALDILVSAASIVVLGFLLEVGTTALWLGAFLTPLLVRAVRGLARDWSRSRKLVGSAVLLLVDGVRSGRLADVASGVGEGVRQVVVTQIAPAVAASAVTVAGFTATEVALGRPAMFFGGDSAAITVLGFTLDEWAPGDAIPTTLVESGDTLRACEVATFTALLRGENGEEGLRWTRRWAGGGRGYVADARWPAEASFTSGRGPLLVDPNTNRPTGEPLPGGSWVLTVLVEGEATAEASVRLVNNAC